MKLIAQVLLMGLLAALLGRSNKVPPKPDQTVPEITSETEEGFVDLVFAITDSQIGSDGTATFHAQGRHQGKAVGLRVLLGPTWNQAILGNVMSTFQGQVFYESTGEESDRLVRALSELYGSSVRPQSMRIGKIPFTGITLSGDPRHLTCSPVKIKLFVESEDEDRYTELYTNIDVGRGRLEIREKDTDYRNPVMRAIGPE